MNTNNDVKILADICDASTKLYSAKASITLLNSKLSNIDVDLQNEGWTGKANVKCQDINTLLKEYNNSLGSLLSKLFDISNQLNSGVQAFESKNDGL